MSEGESTIWTVIERVHEGDTAGREAFAQTYLPVVRSYLDARWRGRPLQVEVDDAVQEVFVDLLKEDGALSRFDRARARGFRPFLRGVTRMVALRVETRAARRHQRGERQLPEDMLVPSEDDALSNVFDRAYARALVGEAKTLHRRRAAAAGPDALRRFELLRLRFAEEAPIREIATLWSEDAAKLHRAYAKARAEFLDALLTVVAEHNPGTPADVRRECEQLLTLLT